MLPILQLNPATVWSDLWTVLALFYLVWIFGWAKKALGSAKLAILFAVIVVYLAFFLHPDLVWIPIVLFVVANFFSPMLEKIDVFK
jgi:TM2 domain-containing membrane protein YozV